MMNNPSVTVKRAGLLAGLVSVIGAGIIALGSSLLPKAPLAPAYDGTATITPTATLTPTATATARPFGFTPRPTSTGLTPRPATPTPQTVAATPGPCTIVKSASRIVCKTIYPNTSVTTTFAYNGIQVGQTVTTSVFEGSMLSVLTSTMMTNLYGGYGALIAGDKPDTYLRFSEFTGTVAYDSSGYGNHLNVSGNVALSVTGAISEVNPALRFITGTLSSNAVDTTTLIDNFSYTNSFSIEFWVARSQLTTTQAIIGKPMTTTHANESYSIWFSNTNRIQMYIGSTTITSSQLITDTAWRHVVATYNGVSATLYVNGALSAIRALSMPVTNTASLYIGSDISGSNFLSATLDELAIYHYVLSSAQVAQHYVWRARVQQSGILFDGPLLAGTVITVAPRYQAARGLTVITLTAQLSTTDWISSTGFKGLAPPSSTVDLRYYRLLTTTNFFSVKFYTTTASSTGMYTLPLSYTLAALDFWQVWNHTGAGGNQPNDVDTISAVYVRRLYLPVVSNNGQ